MSLHRSVTRPILALAVSLVCSCSPSQKENAAPSPRDNSELRANIAKILDTVQGKMGISLKGLTFEDTLSVNGHDRFPMQSTYKFPLAIAVLDRVDKGELKLEQRYPIKASKLDDETWSPMREDLAGKDSAMTLLDLLRYTVSKSDNIACDMLFEIVGGTAYVNAFIHKAGVSQIAIVETEAKMHEDEQAQFTNWCEPVAMTQLLELFYQGKLMKKQSNDLLMKLMTESENSPKRIKGLLPENAVVAHKTGSSGILSDSTRAAINDVAVVTLPDKRGYALTIFLTKYRGSSEAGEASIAAVSKAIWDFYTKP